MEVILYLNTLLISAFGLWRYRSRKNLSWFAFLVFSCLVAIPSYPVYSLYYSGVNFVGYFASILVYQLILLGGVSLSTSGYHMAPQDDSRRWHGSAIVGGLVVLTCAAVYIYVAVRAYGGGLPVLELAKGGSSPVSFRIELWREVLPRIPMASLLRFLAKTGTIYVGLRLVSTGHRKLAWVVLAVALVVSSIEGTKSSLIAWGFPLVVFATISRKSKALVLASLVLVITIGTIGLSFLEANLDLRSAFWDKTLERVFIAPARVSMVHYDLFRDDHLFGATNEIIMGFRGGPAKVLPGPALDYDNYVMRYAYYEMTRQEKTYGSMNAPAFIYGWVDFGLVGVVIIGVFTVASTVLLDTLVKKRQVSTAFISIAPYIIAVMMTSRNYWDSFIGPEGISSLIALDVVFGRERDMKSPSFMMWTIILLGSCYYALSFLVRYLP